MPEITDPELLKILNAPEGNPATPRQGPIYGPPAKVDPYRDEDQQIQRDANARASAAEARARADFERRAQTEGLPQGYRWVNGPGSEMEFIPGGPADPSVKERGASPIPEGTMKRTEGNVVQYTGLRNSADSFKDDFGGNPIGGLENWAQQYVDVGTPGQRAWWSEFKNLDNQIRNDLFGSALTETEKEAYEQTTVEPSMRPEIIKENLRRRADIVGTALSRQREVMIANGYRPEAVDALFAPILQGQKALIDANDAGDAKALDADAQKSIALWGKEVLDENGRPLGPEGGGGFDKDGKYLGIFAPVTDEDTKSPLQTDLIAQGRGVVEDAQRKPGNPLAAGVGDIVQGIGDMAGIVGNPLNATINAATGSNLSTDLGGTLRDMTGLPDNDPLYSEINRGAVGALTGSLGARGAASIAQSSALREALASIGNAPLTDMAAGASGVAGAEIARQSGAGPVGQIAAGVLAGAPAIGISSLISAARRARVPTEIAAAAERQGIDMLPADVGGAGTRMASAVTEKTLGGIPMAEGARRSIATASAARDRVASSIGRVTDEAGAGQAAQRGAQQFITDSKARGGELFDKIPVPDKANAVTDNTRQALGEITQGMESNPELSKLWTEHPRLKATLEALTPNDTSARANVEIGVAKARLEDLQVRMDAQRNGIADPREVQRLEQEIAATKSFIDQQKPRALTPPGGNLSWEDMKRLRTIVGEIVGQPGLGAEGNQVAAMRKLYGALTTDMEATAQQTGPRALTEFRRANQYWRGREDRIEQVLSGILGGNLQKGDEAAFEQINRWAQAKGGDSLRLARAVRSLPEEDANTVRATLIGRMGKASPGRQNADGTEFSPAEFATQWNKLSPRAKSTLFPSEQHRAALNDLALVMDGMKRAGQYSNTSNTGLVGNATAHVAAVGVSPMATAIAAASEFGLGKLLASPGFARWLARTPVAGANPGTLKLHITRLGALASREAGIANDARALQARLQEAFGQSPPLKAAASEEDAKKRKGQ